MPTSTPRQAKNSVFFNSMLRISREDAPSDFNIPISRVRSSTAGVHRHVDHDDPRSLRLQPRRLWTSCKQTTFIGVDAFCDRLRIVDLSEVTSIDRNGEEILMRMIHQGARCTATGIYTRHLFEEL